MHIQTVIVTLIVIPSVFYAAWMVMPSALRVIIARVMLHADFWPARTRTWLQKTAAGNSDCGCSGCDNNPAAPIGKADVAAARTHVIRFHPRARR